MCDHGQVGLLQLFRQRATRCKKTRKKKVLKLNVNPFGKTKISINQPTGGASPSGDVAEVVVGQDLSRWGQRGQLDVRVEFGRRGQTQQSNVVSEVESRVCFPLGCFFFFF